MSIRRSRSLLFSAAMVLALSGCESVTLRPRSMECTIATVISSVGCQPMERAAAAKDDDKRRTDGQKEEEVRVCWCVCVCVFVRCLWW